MISYPITMQQEPIFWLGDRFFKVESIIKSYDCKGGRITYETPCPSCNDTRKIVYKGFDGKNYETECPICRGSVNHGYGNCIELRRWQIHEYIVHKISAQGPETLSVYKDGVGYVDSVRLSAFCKTGRCMDDYLETYVPSVKNVVDRDIDSIDILRASVDGRASEYVFKKKKNAEKL